MKHKEVFIAASRFVQEHMSLEAILNEWIRSGLGNPPKLTTIERWMMPGPKTKNIYFEPFICELATKLWIQQNYATHPEWDQKRWERRQ